MPIIIIQNTVIDFPNSAREADWSPAVIQFAEAVEGALAVAVGPYDVSPQVFILTNNYNNLLPIPNLQFSPNNVRSTEIRYSVWRETDTTTHFTEGTLNLFYDTRIGDWCLQREDNIGNVINEIRFDVSNNGQILLNTVNMSGIDYNGSISYYAKSLQRY